MAVSYRRHLLCAALALTLSSVSAFAEEASVRDNPEPKVAAEPQTSAPPEPTARSQAEKARRRGKAEPRKSRAQRTARQHGAETTVKGVEAILAGGADPLAPLTVRSQSGYGDALSAQLTLRDMARKERRMKPVFASPTSVTDRPAPAMPGDKHEVDEVGDEPEAAAPNAPRKIDAPTSRAEADYLVKQTPRVMTHCFPASLRQVLARMSKHFGSPVIVTSGFRSGGRRGSLHRVCKAADIQIAGVRPSQIVGYAQLQDEVGGIGTYRHTRSVHVDVREQKISWYGNRGRGHFRLAKNQFGG